MEEPALRHCFDQWFYDYHEGTVLVARAIRAAGTADGSANLDRKRIRTDEPARALVSRSLGKLHLLYPASWGRYVGSRSRRPGVGDVGAGTEHPIAQCKT